MASNHNRSPSSLDLPVPPPSASPSPLPPQTHSSTPSSSHLSRPIPIEIYNYILHFTFGRHLPPTPLENKLDEPPSLSHLLPLTLVSKGLRELVLPFLYHDITIRRVEDWIQLFDPAEGLLVGARDEETRRRGWLKRLSFPGDHFPVSSWTFSKDQPGESKTRRPQPKLALVDLSRLEDLEEVCIGDWGTDETIKAEIEDVVVVEMEGGPYREHLLMNQAFDESRMGERLRRTLRDQLHLIRLTGQSSFVLNFLFQTKPLLVHLPLDNYTLDLSYTWDPESLVAISFVLHPGSTLIWFDRDEDVEITRRLSKLGSMFPSSRFNLEAVLHPTVHKTRTSLIEHLGTSLWTKDEAGWWKTEGRRSRLNLESEDRLLE